MAKFRGTVQGNRGETSRLGSKNSGMRTSLNSWDKGIDVVASVQRDKIVFEIFETGGSDANDSPILINTIIHQNE